MLWSLTVSCWCCWKPVLQCWQKSLLPCAYLSLLITPHATGFTEACLNSLSKKAHLVCFGMAFRLCKNSTEQPQKLLIPWKSPLVYLGLTSVSHILIRCPWDLFARRPHLWQTAVLSLLIVYPLSSASPLERRLMLHSKKRLFYTKQKITLA